MALNRKAKAQVIADVQAQLGDAGGIVIAEYLGLDAPGVTELRKRAREKGVYLRVLKNTLVKRSIQDSAFSALDSQLSGPLMYAIAPDAATSAKLLVDFAKSEPALVVRGGALPGSVIDAAAIVALAKLPSREELLASLLGTMQAPMANLVRTLNEVPSAAVRVLAAICDQKEGQAA